MAEVNTGGGNDKGGKRKQKKITLRVDFTPMVDMNMLLITFFMFCTTLSKPQTMEIALPDKHATEVDKPKIKPERAMTILAGADNRVFYYVGMPDYNDYTSVKETTYTADGLRKVLLERNSAVVSKINVLKEKRKNKEITEEEFVLQKLEAQKIKEALVVVIKANDDASYKNMVDILDEMLICNVGKYAIVDFTEGDDFVMKNYLSQGHAAAKNQR